MLKSVKAFNIVVDLQGFFLTSLFFFLRVRALPRGRSPRGIGTQKPMQQELSGTKEVPFWYTFRDPILKSKIGKTVALRLRKPLSFPRFFRISIIGNVSWWYCIIL